MGSPRDRTIHVRLIAAKDLFVSQSVLTGESMPVEKHDVLGLRDKDSQNTPFSRQASPLEMNDLSFMGTNVVSETATAVVVATGARTFFGSLAGRAIQTFGAMDVLCTETDLGVQRRR